MASMANFFVPTNVLSIDFVLGLVDLLFQQFIARTTVVFSLDFVIRHGIEL